MAITNLLIKLKPKEVPEFMRDKFFELHFEPKYYDTSELHSNTYVGWVHIRSDGTIEFGEPGA